MADPVRTAPTAPPLSGDPSRSGDSSDSHRPRLHLAYLDGLRGLSAFYVLLFHIVAEGKQILTMDSGLLNLLRFGHEAVVVFIVLSGFVLTLPVARSPSLPLAGGLTGFAARRARRILPPYYPALLMSPLFLVLIALLKQYSGADPDWAAINALFFGPEMLLSLVMLQNLLDNIPFALNPVLWSVATEWWIYYVFALCLLPIWRRTSVTLALLVSLGLGLLPLLLALFALPELGGYPYLLGAFGLGMFAAAALYSCEDRAWRRRLQAKAGLIGWTALALFLCVSLALPSTREDENIRWITDWLVALACSVFIFVTARGKLIGGPISRTQAQVVQVRESRPLAFLGRISYSLYLTHLMAWGIIVVILGTSDVAKFLPGAVESMPMRLCVAVPLLIGFAYIFYRIFERPFLRR